MQNFLFNGVASLHIKQAPIKIQGSKRQLINTIYNNIDWDWDGVWVEPFLGSAVVALNIKPKYAILSDTNVHIINFYKALQNKEINKYIINKYLTHEGRLLDKLGLEHYYNVRNRFNKEHNPLDFLFLNRSCFNGLMRFNKTGYFNTPFCHKNNRFSRAHITTICNQVDFAATVINSREWVFKVSDWRDILCTVNSNDFIYADPPYPERSNTYYNKWEEQDTTLLANTLNNLPCKFIYSTWLSDPYRSNDIVNMFESCNIVKYNHYYHIGPTVDLRHSIVEGLVIKV